MPFDIEALRKEFATRSIDIEGTSFPLALFDVIQPKPYQTQQMVVRFTAENGSTRHSGELHLGVDRYTDTEIADLAVQTIIDIAAGRLPPGTHSMV